MLELLLTQSLLAQPCAEIDKHKGERNMTDQNSPSVASDTTQVRTAQRFGEDWEKEVMRLNKKDIVLMLKNQSIEKEHYDALTECCNKLLDRVQQKKVPFQELNGLMILLNREQPLR